MKRSAGFTLIELIIVIVILGILAVTAAPKFMNMQGDARAVTINAMKGSVQSAVSMVNSKAIIQGKDKSTSSSDTKSVSAGSATVTVVYGYPTAEHAGIGQVLDFGSTATPTADGNIGDWAVDASGTNYVVMPKGMSSTDNCSVTYAAPEASTAQPTYTVVTTGC